MVENPVRAALVGAGLVGQVAHLHTLTQEDSPIRLAGVGADAGCACVDACPQAVGLGDTELR